MPRPPRRSLYDEGEDPDYRFTLANERTFLAWNRTALALIAAGLAVAQLLPDLDLPLARRVLGIPLVVLGGVVAGLSYRRWARNERAMRLGQPLPPSSLPRLLAVGVTVGGVVALVLVVLGRTGRP